MFVVVSGFFFFSSTLEFEHKDNDGATLIYFEISTGI